MIMAKNSIHNNLAKMKESLFQLACLTKEVQQNVTQIMTVKTSWNRS